MLISIIRTVMVYFLMLLFIRLMGKRQVGNMQPYELVITITIAELGVISMENSDMAMINAAVPIMVLFLLQFTVSYFCMRSAKFHGLVSGRPLVVIQNGKFLEDTMRESLVTVDDLLEKMRMKGEFDMKDIAYGILETSGDLSIMLKTEERPVKVNDLDLSPQEETLPLALILDGKVLDQNLKKKGYDKMWLQKNLELFGVSKVQDVFYAQIDENGQFYCQKRSQKS